MDCKEFNDYLPEYEARKLSKNKEIEFLEHKNSCNECREIFDLVINHDNAYNFDEFNMADSNCTIIREVVMDKISNMEYKGYNFKKYNIINITFGSIIIGLMIIGTIESSKNPLFMSSNSLYTNIEKFSLLFENGSVLVMNAYVQSLWYVILIFIVSAFSLSVLECRRLRNDEVKIKN